MHLGSLVVGWKRPRVSFENQNKTRKDFPYLLPHFFCTVIKILLSGSPRLFCFRDIYNKWKYMKNEWAHSQSCSIILPAVWWRAPGTGPQNWRRNRAQGPRQFWGPGLGPFSTPLQGLLSNFWRMFIQFSCILQIKLWVVCFFIELYSTTQYTQPYIYICIYIYMAKFRIHFGSSVNWHGGSENASQASQGLARFSFFPRCSIGAVCHWENVARGCCAALRHS